MYEVPKLKDEAKRVCAARGFESLQVWRKVNRKAAAQFRSRMNKRGEDRTRLAGLISALDSEFKTYLEQWTS